MPPDGGGDMNVVVRVGKVKGETECRADRSVSTRVVLPGEVHQFNLLTTTLTSVS